MTSERELFSGVMINGTLEADVPDDSANLPDWKNPIFIGIGSAKHGTNLVVQYKFLFKVRIYVLYSHIEVTYYIRSLKSSSKFFFQLQKLELSFGQAMDLLTNFFSWHLED